MLLERARECLPRDEGGVSCAERRTAGRVAVGFGRPRVAAGGRAYLQKGQVHDRQARAQQARCFRLSVSSESIPQPASVGEVDTRACGLLAAGLARAARRWKRPPRGAKGDAVGLSQLLAP